VRAKLINKLGIKIDMRLSKDIEDMLLELGIRIIDFGTVSQLPTNLLVGLSLTKDNARIDYHKLKKEK